MPLESPLKVYSTDLSTVFGLSILFRVAERFTISMNHGVLILKWLQCLHHNLIFVFLAINSVALQVIENTFPEFFMRALNLGLQ